jgi:flagellar basal-body rod modification protein FlgD
MSAADTGMYESKSAALGKDDFLTLLLTQLQNQDPLNPADSTEYTAQLAQFSSLEQLGNINDNLEYMHLFQASINNAQAVSFIGKEILAVGNEIQVNDGAVDACHFELSADAAEGEVNIYDSAGNLVKVLAQDAMNAGPQNVMWDGTDQNGNPVASGSYAFEVTAVDRDDQVVPAITYTSGVVSGVTFIEGTTYFLVGDQKIPIADIVEVVEPASEES